MIVNDKKYQIGKDYKISQSLVKDVINGACKYYIEKRYIKGEEFEATPAMNKGRHFETKLLGSARGGGYELQKKKNGAPYAAELEVNSAIELARRVFEESGIEIGEVQKCLETDREIGHIDNYTDNYIDDVKFTGEALDRWNWSYTKELKEAFQIQGLHYQYIDQITQFGEITAQGKDFRFLVFSEKEWFRGFIIPYSKERIDEYYNVTLGTAIDRLHNLDEPTSYMCSKCNLSANCEKRVLKINFEEI